MQKNKQEALLIAAITPSLLEKGAVLFADIQTNNLRENPWLARNIFIIEAGKKISLSAFLRKLAELGYTKTWETRYRGEFSQRGGVVYVFPINADASYTIEFDGNCIATISKNQNVVEENSRRRCAPLGLASAQTRGIKNFQTQRFSFKSDDYVVHIDHGIGIFRGETHEDFIIEYAPPVGRPNKPDLLYIPKTPGDEHRMFIKRVQPYLGLKKPTIHRLGTSVWAITKKKAKEDIVAYAKVLLETIAKRHTITRAPYSAYPEQEETLEASFIHTDTPDQKYALVETFRDFSQPYPMERILTGDVGFGKTEVALRIALRVILNSRQVILLTPTTTLADQHYELFKSRLEPFGIEVRRLTRLENKKEIEGVLKGIREGSVDVVIGTHKLFGLGGRTSDGGSTSVFKYLGLLIIDEEQKFGVAHKEHFKKLYPAIDILTLSATPIPRTLHLGLSKIQSLSHITTPPKGRRSIKTFVLPKNPRTIKKAIEHELARCGQVYFLANRIHKMSRLLEEIRALKINFNKPNDLPLTNGEHGESYEKTLTSPNPPFVRRGKQVVIAILHGRMNEKQIIKTMHDFREHKIDILISTTIIENGLDISNANTLIVEDATKLGLSQAHQLRGRVGRGDKEAYAYFLYPSRNLQERAAERLEALERYAWLGAGIEIAKRDLELRGCGNILGKAQSGIAYKVGLNLYFQMLEEAIGNLKNQSKLSRGCEK